MAGANVLFGSGGGQVPGYQGPIVDPGTALAGGGTDGNDTLIGTSGADLVQAGAGNDYVSGLDGNDRLAGGDGSDVLVGGAGADSLNGDQGNDNLIGGADADVLDGGAGSDLFDGGAGADVLFGGADGDFFVFGPGDDTIMDFDAATGDTIVFDAALGVTAADVSISVEATGTVVSYGGDSVLLANYFGSVDLGNAVNFDHFPTDYFI